MDTKAAFEKWLKEKMPNLYHMAFIAEEDEMTNHFKASVFDMRTAWEAAWTASRAAIEIELPDGDMHMTYSGHQKLMLPNLGVRKAITSHGIRIKGKTE
ncbi:hypothetical protein AB6896_01880 [Rahnella inusitata]|uniref:hypothetical protein n=1 Tax=Rahnella inusitata TaxID=58169 RepID=UPI0039BEB13D